MWLGKALGRNNDVATTYGKHKEGGYQGNQVVVATTLLGQEYRYGKQGEDGEGLVDPRKVAPNGFEPFRIAEAVNEHTNGKQKQRNTD